VKILKHVDPGGIMGIRKEIRVAAEKKNKKRVPSN